MEEARISSLEKNCILTHSVDGSGCTVVSNKPTLKDIRAYLTACPLQKIKFNDGSYLQNMWLTLDLHSKKGSIEVGQEELNGLDILYIIPDIGRFSLFTHSDYFVWSGDNVTRLNIAGVVHSFTILENNITY